MTVLALRLCGFANGVSKLHGEVSRDMWTGAYGDRACVAGADRLDHQRRARADLDASAREAVLEGAGRLAAGARVRCAGPLANAAKAEAAGLWALRNRLRGELVRFVRSRAVMQACCRGGDADHVDRAATVLSEGVLTIGFARRFATYKRAVLLFSDPKRLAKIVNHPKRPVQFVFSGKAHPRDLGGQAYAQQVFEMTRRAGVHGQGRPARGVRHGDRPVPDLGLRRLAEHAASPARGERHERHEGAAQRRHQLLDRRRMVARVRRRHATDGRSTRAGSARRPRRRTRPMPRPSTRCSRRSSSPSSTTATARGYRGGG